MVTGLAHLNPPRFYFPGVLSLIFLALHIISCLPSIPHFHTPSSFDTTRARSHYIPLPTFASLSLSLSSAFPISDEYGAPFFSFCLHTSFYHSLYICPAISQSCPSLSFLIHSAFAYLDIFLFTLSCIILTPSSTPLTQLAGLQFCIIVIYISHPAYCQSHTHIHTHLS